MPFWNQHRTNQATRQTYGPTRHQRRQFILPVLDRSVIIHRRQAGKLRHTDVINGGWHQPKPPNTNEYIKDSETKCKDYIQGRLVIK